MSFYPFNGGKKTPKQFRATSRSTVSKMELRSRRSKMEYRSRSYTTLIKEDSEEDRLYCLSTLIRSLEHMFPLKMQTGLGALTSVTFV